MALKPHSTIWHGLVGTVRNDSPPKKIAPAAMGRRPSVTQADILPGTGDVGGSEVRLHVRLAKVPTERLAPTYRSAMVQAFSIVASRNGAAG